VQRRFIFMPALAFATFTAACAVTTQQAAQMGAEQAAQLNQQLPLVRNASADQYVEQLGQRIVSQTPYAGQDFEFNLYRSDEVNAFALPGGFIYVSTGLVDAASNEAELAGVLAHEIAHVTLGHSAEQINRAQKANLGAGLICIFTTACQSGVGRAAINVGGSAYLAKFSRAAEREADVTAIQYVVASGIHPRGLVTMFEKLARLSRSSPGRLEAWFATHPQAEDRAQYVQARISQIPASRLSRLSTNSTNYAQFQRLVASAR
jgi:beta-barrel assembly-enhancing protease